MRLIDTHCHIYSEEFDVDRAAMMSRAENEGIAQMLMPAIDRSSHDAMQEAEAKFAGRCLSMMGLHPCSVKENFREEIDLAAQLLKEKKFIAIGETGLDFYWDLSFTKEQYEAFGIQIEWALEHDIPVVIHSRNSIEECIGEIAKRQLGKLKGVFHCFTGSEEQARKIIDLNFYLGIGGVLTFKNSQLDEVIRKIGMDNLILETDAPYLAPVPFRGKRNECAYLKQVAIKLADVLEIPLEELAERTTATAEKLFNL
jgi:TatD DNase family protein